MGGRFRVISMGPVCVDLAGGSNVGRFVDDCVAAPDRPAALEPYRACVTQALPLFSNAAYTRSSHSRLTVHRLYLFCADDGRTVDTMLIGVNPADGRGIFGAVPQAPLSLV